MRKRICLVVSAAIFLASAFSHAEPIPLQLNIGETKAFQQYPKLKVAFLDVVSESRCPEEVTCVHAGWATAIIHARYNDLHKKAELSIRGGYTQAFAPAEPRGKTPGSGNVLNIGPYQIVLVKLAPYPHPAHEIKKTDYQASFTVTHITQLPSKIPY